MQQGPNFGQRNWANAATTSTGTPNPSASNQSQHFVLSAQIPNTPGQSGVLIDVPIECSPTALISKGFESFQKGKIPSFMDSGVSDTMFVSKDVFTDYKPITPHIGNFLLVKEVSLNITELKVRNETSPTLVLSILQHWTPTSFWWAHLIGQALQQLLVMERELSRKQTEPLCWLVRTSMGCIFWRHSMTYPKYHLQWCLLPNQHPLSNGINNSPGVFSQSNLSEGRAMKLSWLYNYTNILL